MGKKNNKKKKIKVRHQWKINPETKVHKDQSIYDRSKQKQELREILDEEIG